MSFVVAAAAWIFLAQAAPDLPPGHPALKGGSAPTTEELLKHLDSTPDLKSKDKTFEVATTIGKVYYTGARYAEAAEYFHQAELKAEPLRSLYLAEKKRAGALVALPAPEKVGCAPNSEIPIAQWIETVRQKSRGSGSLAAASCARAALQPVLELQEGRAKALFLSGDAPGAISEYDQLLQVDNTWAEALFGRAMVRLDSQGDNVKALKLTQQDLEALLSRAPSSPRALNARQVLGQVKAALAAGGVTALARKRAEERRAHPPEVASAGAPVASDTSPPPLTKEMVEAVQNTERTPELEKGLAQLVEQGEESLAHGKYQDALDAYKRVVPFQPENGRARAGMAWALVGLGKPMADRVWGVAVSGNPSAVDKLGETLKSKGDARGATALWQKLAATDPAYAQRSGLVSRLK